MGRRGAGARWMLGAQAVNSCVVGPSDRPDGTPSAKTGSAEPVPSWSEYYTKGTKYSRYYRL